MHESFCASSKYGNQEGQTWLGLSIAVCVPREHQARMLMGQTSLSEEKVAVGRVELHATRVEQKGWGGRWWRGDKSCICRQDTGCRAVIMSSRRRSRCRRPRRRRRRRSCAMQSSVMYRSIVASRRTWTRDWRTSEFCCSFSRETCGRVSASAFSFAFSLSFLPPHRSFLIAGALVLDHSLCNPCRIISPMSFCRCDMTRARRRGRWGLLTCMGYKNTCP